MKILSFLINTNVYISLAAVFLTLETQVQLGMKPQLYPYLYIIFFATIFEYNLHRLITVITNPDSINGEKHKWVREHRMWFYVLVAVSVLGFGIASLLAQKEVLLVLAPIGALTLFYSLPVFKTKRSLIRLREIPLLKIFIISFVWSATTILLPIIQSGNSFGTIHVFAMLIERFLFVFAITVPFDIRDIESDKISGLKTLPLLIGKKNSLRLANIALTLFLLLGIYHYQQINLVFLTFTFFVSGISTFIFINVRRISRLPHYHYGILDGTMLFQGVLACVFYYFFPKH